MQRLGRISAAAAAIVALATAPLLAQTIDSHGIRSGNVRIDATGVHTGTTDVTASGVRTGRGGGTTIDTNGQRRSVSCAGGSLVVNGNHNDLSVTDCGHVTLAGNDNVASIAFARAGSLTVPGNRNVVRWSAPRDVRVGVASLGTRNRVTRGR